MARQSQSRLDRHFLIFKKAQNGKFEVGLESGDFRFKRTTILDTADMKDFMDQVRKNLQKYCVSLALARKDNPGPRGWKYATGILFLHRGRQIVLTAGHWVDEVTKALKQSVFEEIQIRYSHVSNQLDARKISTEYDVPKLLHRCKDFDFAWMELPQAISDEISRQGNKTFSDPECCRGTLKENHLTLLCGYPVQATIITQHPSFYTKQDGQLLQHDLVSLGSLAFQSTLLRLKESDLARLETGFDCEQAEHLFMPVLGAINAHENPLVTSAQGMSGGPVIAFGTTEPNLMEPKLFGLQISEKSIERSTGTQTRPAHN